MYNLKKTGATLFIILSLILSFPKKTNAQYVDLAYVAKEFGIDTIAWTVANMFLKKITAQTVNWINSGFQGSPSYVQNPKQFFLNVADQTASQFLSSPALNNLCTPFRAQVRLALVRNYLQDDNGRYSCSLGILANNFDQFTQDFSQGGWEGWFNVTQNDANNPYGAYLQAQSSLSNKLGEQQNKYINQLQQGQGFLSYEKCPDGYEPPTGGEVCLFGAEKVSVTPGTVIANKLTESLSGDTKRIIQADEISEIISALLNQLTSKVLSSSGLFGASNSSGGQPSYTSGLSNETETPPTQEAPSYNIPPCPIDQGYPCKEPTNTGGNDCAITPTATQEQETRDAINFMLPLLEAIPKPDPVMQPAPYPQAYQDAVQDIINQSNAQWPSSNSVYYPGENDIGMPYTYIVGPNTTTVSNIIPPGDTWRWTWRVMCDGTTPSGGGGGGGGTTTYQVDLCPDVNGQGICQPFTASDPDLRDNFSSPPRSIYATATFYQPNFIVILYSGVDFTGNSYRVTNNVMDLSTTPVSWSTASIQITQP